MARRAPRRAGSTTTRAIPSPAASGCRSRAGSRDESSGHVTLIYSMSVSVDGFIADREGAFAWTAPSEELFRFHTEQVGALGGYLLGRRLYETMLVWETDPSLRDDEAGA